jgi:hypothetical protein
VIVYSDVTGQRVGRIQSLSSLFFLNGCVRDEELKNVFSDELEMEFIHTTQGWSTWESGLTCGYTCGSTT